MDSEIAISAQGLTKRFPSARGGTTAVDHVTFEVRRGETYGLIGPDGSGKSTTTRVILGLLTRNEGQSSILGFDSMRDVYEIREQVGYVPQQFALPGDLTVMENMRFFADLHGLSSQEQKQRIPDLLRFAELTEFTSRPAARLSGGMKKKLALARSLIHAPRVVMLDEPTLGVDPVSRREFWNMLGNLRAEQGLTIFICTPYMDEAERCSRIGLIYQGQLIANDTPDRIKSLVPGQLLEIMPSQFAPARDLVTGLEGVLEVQTYGAMLHLFLDNVDRRKPEIEAALSRQGISCSQVRAIEPRMEETFISLIRRREAAGDV